MANGYLYQNVKPATIQNQWLPIMEADRNRRLDQHAAQAKRLDDYQKNLFSSIKDADLEGEFLQQSISAMDEARNHKVQLYNQLRAGEISETDYLLKSAKIDNLPLSIQSAQEVYNTKLTGLVEGDEKMNLKNKALLARQLGGMSLKYDPNTMSFGVGMDDFDGKGNLTGRRDLSMNEYQTEISSTPVVAQLGVPSEEADNYGKSFKADKTRDFGGTTRQGMGVGESLNNFNLGFENIFGSKANPTNQLVMKEIVEDDANLDTYEEAYDHLYNRSLGYARQGNVEMRPTPTKASTTTKPTGIEGAMKKNKVVVLSETGKGGKSLTSITPVGSESAVNGRGMTFDVSGTDKSVEVSAGDIEGVGEKGKTSKVTVEHMFVGDDGAVYIKGKTPLADAFTRMMKGEDVSEYDLMESGSENKSLDWVKIQGASLDRLRSTIMGGEDIDTVSKWLKDNSKGVKEGTTETTEDNPLALDL